MFEEKNKDYNLSKSVQYFKESHPLHLWSKFGLFDDNYIKDINVFWMQFPATDRTYHYILAVLYAIIMTVGWFGNAFVIFMFLRYRSLRTPANILVLNLAVSDMLMMSKMPIFIVNSMYFGPVLGRIGCSLYGFIGGLSGTVSICTLAAISLDRYYVIEYPLNMRFTSLRAKIYVIIVWCYGGIFSSVPLFRTKLGSYVPEGYLTSCSFDYLTSDIDVKIFIFTFFIAAWLIPFILITYCYVSILRTVLQTQGISSNIDQESSRHVKEKEKRRQEIKLTLTVLIIISLWFLAWTPYAVVALLGIANRKDLITPLTSMIPALFCKTSSCLDPFLYTITNPKFKNELQRFFQEEKNNKFLDFETFNF